MHVGVCVCVHRNLFIFGQCDSLVKCEINTRTESKRDVNAEISDCRVFFPCSHDF